METKEMSKLQGFKIGDAVTYVPDETITGEIVGIEEHETMVPDWLYVRRDDGSIYQATENNWIAG